MFRCYLCETKAILIKSVLIKPKASSTSLYGKDSRFCGVFSHLYMFTNLLPGSQVQPDLEELNVNMEDNEDAESTKSEVKLGKLQFSLDYDFQKGEVRQLSSLPNKRVKGMINESQNNKEYYVFHCCGVHERRKIYLRF